MVNEYQQKEQLIGQLSKWWVANGWRIETLRSKSVQELLRIRTSAQGKKWAITSHRRRA